MNYDDEDYVRLYTRDTVTWKMLGWQGQTVLLHMLKGKFDRAGVFVTDRHAPSRAVMAATDLPIEVVEPGLAKLLEEKVLVEGDGCLVWPTFVEAQTAVRSDKARKRDERARRAAQAAAKKRASRDAFGCDTESRNVTGGHVESRDVTKCHPSRAEPNRAEDLSSTSSPVSAKADDRAAIVRRVFEAWKIDTGKLKAKLTDDKKRRILARLREGYTEEDLLDAIEGRHSDPWLMGTDPKSTKAYDGIETIFKTGSQVEKLRDLRRAVGTTAQSSPVQQQIYEVDP